MIAVGPTGPQPVRTGLSCRGSSLRDSHTETTAASIRAVKESKNAFARADRGEGTGEGFREEKKSINRRQQAENRKNRPAAVARTKPRRNRRLSNPPARFLCSAAT